MLFDLETQNVPTATRKQLNLQAAVLIFTILAVAALQLPWRLEDWTALEWGGVGALVSFAAAFGATVLMIEYGANSIERILLILLQIAIVVIAFDRFRNYPGLVYTVPALLIVVATQFATLFRDWVATLLIVISSLAFWGVSLINMPWPGALLPTLVLIAFQGYAVSIIASRVEVDRARGELARSNAELVSMQSFVAETVRDRERLRIARDLHDVTGHKLTALKINLQIMQQRVKDNAELRDFVDRAAQIADDLLSDTRVIVRQISGAEGLALGESLTKLASLLPDGMITVELEEGLRVQSGEVARLLLRAGQEGTSNALRHGGANRIQLSLRRIADRFVMRIIDNGRGLRGKPAGFGRSQLAARVKELNGEYRLIDHAATGGTGCELEITLPDEASPNA
ncbi:MAG: histidine kinase [Xanthomonadales bacterium]|jgi:signal transduction histidine kinase|nr:histidine kinase [Xanthomonadales bacterium]